MVKKLLIAIVVFYFLGVFGVSGGYLSQNWDDEWGLAAQLGEAVRVGVFWPVSVAEIVAGP